METISGIFRECLLYCVTAVVMGTFLKGNIGPGGEESSQDQSCALYVSLAGKLATTKKMDTIKDERPLQRKRFSE